MGLGTGFNTGGVNLNLQADGGTGGRWGGRGVIGGGTGGVQRNGGRWGDARAAFFPLKFQASVCDCVMFFFRSGAAHDL